MVPNTCGLANLLTSSIEPVQSGPARCRPVVPDRGHCQGETGLPGGDLRPVSRHRRGFLWGDTAHIWVPNAGLCWDKRRQSLTRVDHFGAAGGC